MVQWLESDVILGRLYEITFGYNVQLDGVGYEHGAHQWWCGGDNPWVAGSIPARAAKNSKEVPVSTWEMFTSGIFYRPSTGTSISRTMPELPSVRIEAPVGARNHKCTWQLRSWLTVF